MATQKICDGCRKPESDTKLIHVRVINMATEIERDHDICSDCLGHLDPVNWPKPKRRRQSSEEKR